MACSFDQFRSRLVDARSYLTLRAKYPFGSVRDPSTGTAVYDLEYIPLDIVSPAGSSLTTDDVAQLLESGKRVVLTGDYGAGKSATTRQVYKALAKRFWDKKSLRFPVLLNLRDHHGQTRSS